MSKYPAWATKKQIEGMEEFCKIASEYGHFEISFKKHDGLLTEDCHQFDAIVYWGHKSTKKDHKFNIAFDYESLWDRYGDRVFCWQFVFADGDATAPISTEVFFVDLFYESDKRLDKKMERSVNG